MSDPDALLQILADEGQIAQVAHEQIGRDLAVCLYRTMRLTRLVDTKALALQRQGRIGFYGSSRGLEACYVASTLALHPEDWIFPHYRGQGAIVARGLPLSQFFAQLCGSAADWSKGRQTPLSFAWQEGGYVAVSSPVGNMCPQAVGAALAARRRGEPRVMLVQFGEGATSTGDFHVGMNFAGVSKAGVVFFCVNNQWAISVPLERQTASATIAVKGIAYGVPGVRVDGNDALAVYLATKSAAERARRGEGPTLIEGVTFRVDAHSTSDDPSRYQVEEQVVEWQARDPITRLRRFLLQQGWWSEEEDTTLEAEFTRAVDAAVHEAEVSPAPAPRTLVEDVYSNLPRWLEEELSQAI